MTDNDKTDLRQRIKDLEHRLRVAVFNEGVQRHRAEALAANFKRWQNDERDQMRRVQALVNVRRKTLLMHDLRQALGLIDADGTQPVTATEEGRPMTDTPRVPAPMPTVPDGEKP